jgi:hypothetical protein
LAFYDYDNIVEVRGHYYVSVRVGLAFGAALKFENAREMPANKGFYSLACLFLPCGIVLAKQ